MVATLLAAAAVVSCGADDPAAPRLELRGDAELGWSVEVTGTGGADAGSLAVYTGGREELRPGRRAVVGDVETDGARVRWQPRFALDPGRSYTAVWTPDEGAPAATTFEIPMADAAPTTTVRAVHPSIPTVPENLLRVYIEFSGPMSRGRARHHFELVDEDGTPVAGAFVLPEQELWSPAGDRLTLLFDPGRLKQDVGPNVTMGPPLRHGRQVRLRVAADWPDARGRPLTEAFEQSWSVGPADRARPSVAEWRVLPPTGPIAPVVLELPEPLDHALLERMITVETGDGERIDGVARAEDHDRRWLFLPAEPWSSGSYWLRVDPDLEDLAGNDLARRFDEPLDPDRVGVPAIGAVLLEFELARRP